MKALILLATLKKDGLSNTETLCGFLAERMKKRGIDCETIKLIEHRVLSGTYLNMGRGDGWPAIAKKILAVDIVIFATPIWWGSQSSEMQRVLERLDELHDEILKGKKSRLDGKVAGIVVTGDSDGAEHVIGNLANYFNAIGLILPPYSTLTVLWDGQAKDKKTSKKQLLAKYKKEYSKTADTMADQMVKFAGLAI